MLPFFPGRRVKRRAWVKAWLDHYYTATKRIPLQQVRAEMWQDYPLRFIPDNVAYRWFIHTFAGDVRAAGWAFTNGSRTEQLAFKWDMPLRDFVDYEIGKAVKARTDLDAIRTDLEEYQARTGMGFNIDMTLHYIKRAAGL